MKPQFGEQKEFIFQEGSFKSIESESPSATPPPYNEDLRKLRIGKFEFTPTYYHNRKRLQVVIRRVTCYPVCQSLLNVAYLYIVACLLPDKKDFFESELQQINEDNLVDEMCEFEVSYADLDKRVLLFEIHVCDRFSRHLMISDLKYDLLKRPRTEHEESSLEKLDFKEHTGHGDVSCILRFGSLKVNDGDSRALYRWKWGAEHTKSQNHDYFGTVSSKVTKILGPSLPQSLFEIYVEIRIGSLGNLKSCSQSMKRLVFSWATSRQKVVMSSF